MFHIIKDCLGFSHHWFWGLHKIVWGIFSFGFVSVKYKTLLYTKLKSKTVTIFSETGHCTEVLYNIKCIAPTKVYNFSIKHFSVWWIFNKIQGKHFFFFYSSQCEYWHYFFSVLLKKIRTYMHVLKNQFILIMYVLLKRQLMVM